MINIKEIINYSEHPIDNTEYINFCKKKISDKSILVLNNFLNQKCLDELIFEASNLENKAFYCNQNHTILLDKYDKSLDNNDPLNINNKVIDIIDSAAIMIIFAIRKFVLKS